MAAGFTGVTPYGTRGGPTKPTPVTNNPGRPNADYYGSGTNARAVAGAKQFKDALGLPSYQDILGKFGQGTTEYGNSGLAATGASELHGQLGKTRNDLLAQKANIAQARNDIRNPTNTEGFKNIMRLTNERLGNQQENDRRLAAEAASRRGYVGGYSPERGEQDRREATATAGYEAAGKEREAQQALFGGEAGLYGDMLGGYGQELGAYTDLTKTAAELPTKQLSALSGLLGSAGGFGDIYGTAMKGAMFDEGNRREDAANYWRQFDRPAGASRSGSGSLRSG